MTITNIQNLNARQQSYYPFDSMSTLQIDNMIFPVSLIKSLNIQVQSAVFPLKITQFRIARDKKVLCCIRDSISNIIGFIQLDNKNLGSVVDQQGRYIGGISFQQQLYTWLYRSVTDAYYKNIQVATNALIISSQCITCVHYTGFKGVSVNGTYAGNNVTLNFQRNIQCNTTAEQLQLSLCADYVNIENILVTQTAEGAVQETPVVFVNGVDLTDKVLIIKHRNLSDLRVKTTRDRITFVGVQDVL